MATKNDKKRKDLNELAFSIVQQATDEDQPKNPTKDETPQKNPHAQALGRLGGLKGGHARAKALTKEQRRKIAKKAALARWKSRT